MDTIKLDKGIIYLMLPFRMHTEGVFGNNMFENEIWQNTGEDISGLDFLLEYVKLFFTKNCGSEKIDEIACLILKLRKDALPLKMFNNKIFWVSNRPFEDQQKYKNALKFPASIDPQSFRIIIHPFTRVAILTYSIELAKSPENHDLPNLSDLIRLNYLLRSFSRNDEAFLISQNERPEERKKALLLLDGEGENLLDRTAPGDISVTGWRPGHLINYLLKPVNRSFRIDFFNNYHFVPISYVQTVEEIKDETIISRALFYLRKLYDFDYQPASDTHEDKDEIIQPFKQIYYASSLEGAVVLNNSHPDDPEFLKRFHTNSFQKSQWLYLLGLLQRTFFLELLNEVYEIDPGDHNKVKEYLRRYASISFKAIFSKVSVYHQHNDFYDLIIKSFHVKELRTEMKDELQELNGMLRQFHEDEVEENDELERKYDRRLNIILFGLSLLSLTSLAYTIIASPPIPFFEHCLAIGIPVILGFTFWYLLTRQKK
jgi:hypothetical protein